MVFFTSLMHFPPELLQQGFIDLGGRRKDIHHHGHLHRQLEKQPCNTVLRAFNNTGKGGSNCTGKIFVVFTGCDISAVKVNGLFYKLAPAFAIVLREKLICLFYGFGIQSQGNSLFILLCHS
jgi:hypothetical protein